MENDKKVPQENLLKAIADVLEEAVTIYEGEVKKADGIDGATVVSDMSVAPKAQNAPGIGEPREEGLTGGGSMAKEEDKKDKDKDDDKAEKSDAELLDTFKSLMAKMEARGLMEKAEKEMPAKKMKKSEETASDDLRKSVDDRFEKLEKAMMGVAETVKKIASAPRERKGLTGYQPLRKTEATPVVKKGEVIGKLLELKKSGNPLATTDLINRVETGRLQKGDEERIKSLGILGE